MCCHASIPSLQIIEEYFYFSSLIVKVTCNIENLCNVCERLILFIVKKGVAGFEPNHAFFFGGS